jgi:Sulfotransferase domain
MIITPKFVVLNFPKTGSTFVRTVLKEIEQKQSRSLFERLAYATRLKQQPFQELKCPNLKETRVPSQRHIFDQHGTYEQVPLKYRDLPVVSVARNPFDGYVSRFEFRYWARYPVADPVRIRNMFPKFPDLSFAEFLDLGDYETANHRIPDIKPKTELGSQTVLFIQMFFRNPRRTLTRIDEEFIDSGAYKQEIPKLHLLRTESLNQDLYDYLITMGYPSRDIEFIINRKKIQPPEGTRRTADRKWQDYYSPELMQRVYRKEKLLLKIFADFGVGEPDTWADTAALPRGD